MKKTFILAAAALVLAACGSQPKFDGPAYLNPNAPVEERVEDALSRMTLEEKVGMTTAQSKYGTLTVLTESVLKFFGMSGTRQDGQTTLVQLSLH